MTNYTITITDSFTNRVVETVRNARIADRMRIRREYRGLEHDGRYIQSEVKERLDALGFTMIESRVHCA